ncbi:hypothetical protein ILYODFUR_026074 [Ilyodon furcidens]|uniref:Uncharacterized protein n=1 Tax=Ilyodon furcidens TaxID=33524 RepID=A0ABV0TB69_9TELE
MELSQWEKMNHWRKVNLVLDDGRSLGLMIRGGAEYALGIYITGVDKGSAAECGGLKKEIWCPDFWNDLPNGPA